LVSRSSSTASAKALASKRKHAWISRIAAKKFLVASETSRIPFIRGDVFPVGGHLLNYWEKVFLIGLDGSLQADLFGGVKDLVFSNPRLQLPDPPGFPLPNIPSSPPDVGGVEDDGRMPRYEERSHHDARDGPHEPLGEVLPKRTEERDANSVGRDDRMP
jgi:hypothetical protein